MELVFAGEQMLREIKCWSLVLISLVIVGCVPTPASIPATPVPGSQYSQMSCKELAQVLEEEYNELSRLTELQIFDRSWDIALNAILLPGVRRSDPG